MRVEVDLDGVEAEFAQAKRALRRSNVQRVMFETLAPFAEHERRTHAYTNRTGYLEASTVAKSANLPEPAVELVTGPFAPNPNGSMAYASFVNDRGLMTIDRTATRAARAIETSLEKLVK